MSESTRAARHAEQRYQIFVQRNLTRNYFAHLIHGMLGQTGFRFINAPTFVPAYLLILSGGSNLVVGLALSLQAIGQMLMPLYGAHLISHRTRVLPIGFITGSAMRLCVLLMGLFGLMLDPAGTLIAFIILLALFGIFEGMQGVIFNYLMSKVIPVSKRGRLSGLRNFLAGISAATVAYVGGTYLIGAESSLTGYSWTFVMAFVLTSIGLACLLFVNEPEPPIVNKRTSFVEQLGTIPALLREDPAFVRFFLARAVATLGRMAMPFYILYAGQTIGLSGPTLGVITFAFTISATVSNLIWGSLADAKGYRLVFLLASSLWIISAALLLIAPSFLLTVVVFVGIGAAVQGFEISSRNIVLEFGERRDLPVRIAIANTVAQIAGAIGPITGGVISTIYGYESVFVLSIAFLVIGAGLVLRFVPEPRTRVT